MKLFDALISPILFYASEVWGIDCNGQLEKDPAELVQNKFLKWLLGVNKYCNNNACRARVIKKIKPRGIYWPQAQGGRGGGRDFSEKNEKKNKTTSVYRLMQRVKTSLAGYQNECPLYFRQLS